MSEPVEHLAYVTSMREVLWSTALVAMTMVLHGLGMAITSRVNQALRRRVTFRNSFLSAPPLLVLTTWMIVATHIADVMVWGAFLAWRGALPNLSTANYYALLQYTTVGSGISLPYDWRLIGGALPMTGMLTFAWSTAVLLGLVTKFQDEQDKRLSRGSSPDLPQRDGASIDI